VAEITLDNEMFAFSVSGEGGSATLSVLEGSVGWSTQTSGVFAAEGVLAAGETRDFDVPTIISAAPATTIDLAYPEPATPTEPEAPEGEDDNVRPDDPDAGQNPGTP
jgi:hypothetical protein